MKTKFFLFLFGIPLEQGLGPAVFHALVGQLVVEFLAKRSPGRSSPISSADSMAMRMSLRKCLM